MEMFEIGDLILDESTIYLLNTHFLSQIDDFLYSRLIEFEGIWS